MNTKKCFQRILQTLRGKAMSLYFFTAVSSKFRIVPGTERLHYIFADWN